MAWSIFSQPNGDQLATAWAVELLAALGLQATPDRLQFVFDWERSEGGGGAYNPLNQGPVPGQPDLTSTGQQYGGGAADFKGWQAGLLGAVAYLNMPNFRGVLQAMSSGTYASMANALWSSPWAGGHYGYGNAWYTGKYPAMSPAQIAAVGSAAGLTGSGTAASQAAGLGAPGGAAAQNAVGGGSVSTVSAAGTPGYVPPPPAASDAAAMAGYIKTYFPQWTWLLSVPELANIADQVVSAGRANDTAYVNGLLQNTTWWRTTSAAYKDFFQKQAVNPADYSFTTPGSLASQKFAEIMNTSAGLGVQLTADQGRELAINDLKYGWNTQQLQASIGALVTPGDAGAVYQQLQAQNGAYLLPTNPTTLQSWARGVAGGTQTLQQYDAYLKQQASTKWSGWAQQIAEGSTPNQLVDNMRTEAAKTMEVQPGSIDFVNNPTYSHILDFVPPDATAHRVMTLSEMDQYLKQLPAYGYTQNARDAQAGLAQTLAQTFGKVG